MKSLSTALVLAFLSPANASEVHYHPCGQRDSAGAQFISTDYPEPNRLFSGARFSLTEGLSLEAIRSTGIRDGPDKIWRSDPIGSVRSIPFRGHEVKLPPAIDQVMNRGDRQWLPYPADGRVGSEPFGCLLGLEGCFSGPDPVWWGIYFTRIS